MIEKMFSGKRVLYFAPVRIRVHNPFHTAFRTGQWSSFFSLLVAHNFSTGTNYVYTNDGRQGSLTEFSAPNEFFKSSKKRPIETRLAQNSCTLSTGPHCKKSISIGRFLNV